MLHVLTLPRSLCRMSVLLKCTAVVKLGTSAKDGLLANSSEKIVEHIDEKGCNLENEAEIEGMDMVYNRTHDAGN